MGGEKVEKVDAAGEQNPQQAADNHFLQGMDFSFYPALRHQKGQQQGQNARK